MRIARLGTLTCVPQSVIPATCNAPDADPALRLERYEIGHTPRQSSRSMLRTEREGVWLHRHKIPIYRRDS